MKRVFFFTFGILLFSLNVLDLNAQHDQFNSIIKDLKANVKTVETAKITFEQEIKVIQPGVISLLINKIDSKGSKTEFMYEFNLADIDPVMVREVIEKDRMYIPLMIENNQELITTTKNGEHSSYDKSVKLYAEDIDNARIIKELIKKLIPVAENILENKYSLETYKEQLNWLTENIKDVTINNESYHQILTRDDSYVGKLNLEVVSATEKSSKKERFEFNLADINSNSIQFNVTKTFFSIVFETKGKQKVINTFVDDKLSNYANKMEIIAYNIENARDIRYVLSQIIPLAEQELKNAMPVINDANKASLLLSENIKNVIIDNSTYNQSLLNSCITSLNITEDDMKKKVDSRYEFNLSDINHNSIDYKISGKKFALRIQTKGADKLIKVFENDEQQNYTNEIEILCLHMENARLLMHMLKKAVPLCESNIVRLVPDDNLANKVNWLIENTTEVTSNETVYNQLLERISDDNNKLRLTLKKIKDQTSTEYIYEFNLSDINPGSIKYDISGIELSVNLSTNFNSKVIKVYKDGEVQNYTSQLNIYLIDIEHARNIILALKECTEENTDQKKQ